MSTNETNIMILIICLWSAWFFFGGTWALIRFVIGVLGYKDGEDKWSGFKGLLSWFAINAIITVFTMARMGG